MHMDLPLGVRSLNLSRRTSPVAQQRLSRSLAVLVAPGWALPAKGRYLLRVGAYLCVRHPDGRRSVQFRSHLRHRRFEHSSCDYGGCGHWRVSSNHKDGEQPEIIPLGSSFDNLKIATQPLQVDLNHDLFMQYPTHSALLSHYESGSKGNKGSAKSTTAPKARYHWGLSSEKMPPALAKGMLMEPGAGWSKSNGVLHTSLVKQVRPVGLGNSAEELPYAYAIHIPHVGNLYLAELFSSADTKRLTMLRVELGSPFAVLSAAATPVTNGSWYP